MDMFKTRRIVVKVGTSTLTYENGQVNLRRLEMLCKVLSDLHNSGKQIILVSSGAIGVGMGKLKLKKRPSETRFKQPMRILLYGTNHTYIIDGIKELMPLSFTEF